MATINQILPGGDGTEEHSDTVTTFSETAFDSGLHVIQILGYHRIGVGEVWVRRATSEPAHPWKFRSADRFLPDETRDSANGGWWEGIPDTENTVTALQFGAVADDDGVSVGTDDYTYLRDMLDYAKYQYNLTQTGVPGLSQVTCLIPASYYYCSQTLEIDFPVLIRGGGYGTAHVGTTQIRFPAGVKGLIFTNGTGTNSSGSSLERIALQGAGQSDLSGTSNGIEIRSIMNLAFVNVNKFSGDGFWFNGEGLAANPPALCDESSVYNCSAEQNLMSGFHMTGGDANVIGVYSCNAIANGRWGYNDESFLGCTFVSCHARDNGIGVTPSVTNGVLTDACFCSYGGKRWVIVPYRNTIDYTIASTTVPGTDDTVWTWYSDVPSFYTPWVSGQTQWADGGAYKSQSGGNGWSVFMGCYREEPQISWIDLKAISVGGSLGQGDYVYGTGTKYGNNYISRTKFSSSDGSIQMQLGEDTQLDQVMKIIADSSNAFRLKPLSTGGNGLGFRLDWANISNSNLIEFWDANYSVAGGGSRGIPYTNNPQCNFPNGFMLAGSYTLADSVMPTSGTYVVGDFVRNTNPSQAAGKVLLGWIRLTTGSAHVLNTDWSACYCTTT